MDSRVHHALLSAIVARGAAPAADELATALEVTPDEIAASLGRLAANHALVLHPGTLEVWLAHPFSLSPTGVWVESGTEAGPRGWWAPCLWCGLGAATLAAGDVAIHTRLGGEADPVRILVRGGEIVPPERSLVAHFPLPPRRAWDNVVHFCAMLLPFRDEQALDTWCTRHRLPRGQALALPVLHALAHRWYGGHLATDWVKHSADQAAAIFAEVGLTGEFWSTGGGAGRF